MFRTKRQEKRLCACPIASAAHLLGDSTVLLIVRDLLKGPKRFSDMERAFAGVSTRTIANKLRWLLCHGLVEQKKARGPYALTERGEKLRGVLAALRAFDRAIGA
jgi:DNA-binding HxlR family transcriptional regulator